MNDAVEIDPNPGAVISDDHADPSLSVDRMHAIKGAPRIISAAEVEAHNGKNTTFWAVVDNFVVDATEMVETHPGGLKKLLLTNAAAAGATGNPFGFSFSRGKNAHFPDTGKRFQAGIKRYLTGEINADSTLKPVSVDYPQFGKIVILGRLQGT